VTQTDDWQIDSVRSRLALLCVTGEIRRPCFRRGATCVLQRKVAHVSVPTPPQEQSWPGLRAEIRPSLINSHRTHLDLKRVTRTHQ
jgi:hypothetical protein